MQVKLSNEEQSTFELTGKDLESILQYSGTRGINPLLKHLHLLQTKEHGTVQPKPFEICITTGSQDALTKAFDLFTGAGEDEAPMLVEEPTYSGSLAYLQPTGTKLVGVKCDENGIIPESLNDIMNNWDKDPTTNRPRPKVLYTIPSGSNPTGASLTNERKKEIYKIASKYNLIILEDDPYYWMQFVNKNESRKKSFMSMDVDGRVLRFDSFSKLLSSGLRVGFVTGPPELIERIELHAQASILHSSGVSQALVNGLFDSWGSSDDNSTHTSYDGFVKHCDGIVDFYRIRRDAFVESAHQHLKGLVEFNVPDAGMFCWFKFLTVEDSDVFIKKKARNAKVLLVPGQSFDPLNRPSPYARAAYSTASLEDMDLALKRLGELLKKEKEL